EVADVEGVNPAAAHVPRGDVLEIADDRVALVLLEVLVGLDGITGFGSGIDGVENPGLLVEVIAVALEVLIPVGKLDDDLDLGVDGAGRSYDQVAGRVVHGLYAEVRPVLIALGGDVGGSLGVGEKEVVEDDFI